jgi:hypothetical protein
MKLTMPCMVVAATALVFHSAMAAAPTYKDRLLQDITITMPPSELSIPDQVENDFWRCIASSFVETKVPLTDLTKLDALSAGQWNPKDALVRKYGEQLMAAMKNPKGSDWNDIMSFAQSLECPDTIQSFFDAYKG